MMKLRNWEDLPKSMQTKEVRRYYQILSHRKVSLVAKRIFDVFSAVILLILLSPLMLVISVLVAVDSKGGVFFHQIRVTAYGKKFYIHKFRTMVKDIHNDGLQITVNNDARITKIGKILRKTHLDELPQLVNILNGDMSFVGTRPETVRYVKRYNKEMLATLLLPAGVTSEASIRYKDEVELLCPIEDIEDVYIEEILPKKMKYNLDSIKKFSFIGEIKIMFFTIFAVLGRKYE